MPTHFWPTHARNSNLHSCFVPGTPVITGKPATTGEVGREGTPGSLWTPLTGDATSVALSEKRVEVGTAAGLAGGKGVGVIRGAGVLGEEVGGWYGGRGRL